MRKNRLWLFIAQASQIASQVLCCYLYTSDCTSRDARRVKVQAAPSLLSLWLYSDVFKDQMCINKNRCVLITADVFKDQMCINKNRFILITAVPSTSSWDWEMEKDSGHLGHQEAHNLQHPHSPRPLVGFWSTTPFYFAAVFQIALRDVTLSYCKAALIELSVDPKWLTVISNTDAGH